MPGRSGEVYIPRRLSDAAFWKRRSISEGGVVMWMRVNFDGSDFDIFLVGSRRLPIRGKEPVR